MNTGRTSRRPGLARRIAGLAMLAVLALQILSAAAVAATPRALDAGLGEDHLIVCTAAGMVDLGTADAPAAPATDHGRLCVFCLPLLQGALAAPAAPAPVEPALVLHSVEAGGETAGPCLRPRNLTGAASPHAPPSS